MLSRTLRKIIGRLMIGVVLCAQFAVASHACPGMSATAALSESSADDTAAQPVGVASHGDMLDQDSPNLCAAHCRQGEQSADTVQAPAVHAAIPLLLYALPAAAVRSASSGRACLARVADPAAARAPSHAILHCVLRN